MIHADEHQDSGKMNKMITHLSVRSANVVWLVFALKCKDYARFNKILSALLFELLSQCLILGL